MSACKTPIFQTPYGKHVQTCSPTGDGTEPTYEYVIKNNGSKVLEKTGTKDVYSEIQAQLEDTKIENILKRVAVGDMTDFRPDGIYADTTVVPNNMVDSLKEIQKLNNYWNSLPPEIRREYNNDLNQFVADSGSEKWLNIMGITKEESNKMDSTNVQSEKMDSTNVPIETN